MIIALLIVHFTFAVFSFIYTTSLWPIILTSITAFVLSYLYYISGMSHDTTVAMLWLFAAVIWSVNIFTRI